MTLPIHVIGGGLAGSEAAWQIANAGVPVVLHEMRPGRATEAHRTAGLAELVCSNSFRSDDAETNAVGLLHQEMRALGEENRAKVVEAEAQVPQAIAGAFEKGNLGVMDFYNIKNVQSDTLMRNNIATMTGGAEGQSGSGR